MKLCTVKLSCFIFSNKANQYKLHGTEAVFSYHETPTASYEVKISHIVCKNLQPKQRNAEEQRLNEMFLH